MGWPPHQLPRDETTSPVRRPPLPRARRIKAAQAEFQALKKISGNTHTARTLVPNRLAALFILTGATFLCASGLNNMMLGRNKIVIKDD